MTTLPRNKSAAQNPKQRPNPRVRIGAPDPSLTPAAGLHLLREGDRVLGITTALDAGIGPIKERNRGLTSGQLLMEMAGAQLAGEDHLIGMDRRRADTAAQRLGAGTPPASTTTAGLCKRFGPEQLLGIETALGQVNTTWVNRLPLVRRNSLLKVATLDGDATDIEVYGRQKDQAKHAYTGALTIRAHIGFWAEAGIPAAAELISGTEDPRSNVVELLDRSIGALPDGVQKIRARWDAGYFAGDLARACLERNVEFAIGAKRNGKIMAAATGLGQYTWVPAVGMDETEVAVIDYLPGSWPAGIHCIARRTRIPIDRIPTGRARKRRTIPKNQLALALEGRIDEVFGYSFILTNLPVDTDEDLAQVEWCYRHRTDIEALNKDAKHGAALRHLPSGDHRVNKVWMWAALLGCALSSWIQELSGIDRGNGRGRMTVARFCREVIRVPARIITRGRYHYLRLPPGVDLLAAVLPELQKFPAPS